mmetsp:Transcript_34492/g.75463  ORF Transcript_34492/g.75463 Transcript_34492/m.75463 type:complete len:216 (-) Transcript_34492:440-1087(-)
MGEGGAPALQPTSGQPERGERYCVDRLSGVEPRKPAAEEAALPPGFLRHALLNLNNRCHCHWRADAAALLCGLEDPGHHGLIQVPGKLPSASALLHLVEILADPLQAGPGRLQPPAASADLIRDCSKPLCCGRNPKIDHPKPEIVFVPPSIFVENNRNVEVVILARQSKRVQELPNAVHAVGLVQALQHHSSLLAGVGGRVRGPLPSHRRSHRGQ